MRLRMAAWTGVLSTGAVCALILLSGAGQQPSVLPGTTSPTPLPLPGRANVSEINSLYMPPGRYTAIVIATTAKNRRWIVSLKTTRGSFPITVGDENTIIVPFQGGWQVKADDQARLESRLVPWEDIGERNLLDGNENLALAAWGITDQGPVSFSPPRK